MKNLNKAISYILLLGYIGSFLYCGDSISTVTHEHDDDCGLINKILHEKSDENHHHTDSEAGNSDNHFCHCPCHLTSVDSLSITFFQNTSVLILSSNKSSKVSINPSSIYHPPKIS